MGGGTSLFIVKSTSYSLRFLLRVYGPFRIGNDAQLP